MIENFTSSEKYLYHYTTMEAAIDHIITSRTLKMGKYTETNDPKESKCWQFSLGTNESRDLGQYNTSELSEWLSSALKGKAKLACFSMDAEELSGSHMEDIFNRGFSKPRMWVQYADEHTGVCLVFDRQRLTDAITSGIFDEDAVLHGPVMYLNRSIVRRLFSPDDQQYTINIDYLDRVGREAYVDAHMRSHYKRLFFEKMADWRDESEWRCVVFSETEEDLYVDYKDSLVGVMFGENSDERAIQGLIDATESWGIRYMGLKWKNCSPWYDYGNLRYAPGTKNSPWAKLLRQV
jgi:hypothetical protein